MEKLLWLYSMDEPKEYLYQLAVGIISTIIGIYLYEKFLAKWASLH